MEELAEALRRTAEAASVADQNFRELRASAESGTQALAQFARASVLAAQAQYELSVQIVEAAKARAFAIANQQERGRLNYRFRPVGELTAASAEFGFDFGGYGDPGGVPGGGGGGGGRGPGGATSEPTARQRLGDFLATSEGFSQTEFDVFNRFGPTNQFGPGQRVNLNQNIADLTDAERQELLLDFLDQYGAASQAASQAEIDSRRPAEDTMRALTRIAEAVENCPPPVVIDALGPGETGTFIGQVTRAAVPETSHRSRGPVPVGEPCRFCYLAHVREHPYSCNCLCHG